MRRHIVNSGQWNQHCKSSGCDAAQPEIYNHLGCEQCGKEESNSAIVMLNNSRSSHANCRR